MLALTLRKGPLSSHDCFWRTLPSRKFEDPTLLFVLTLVFFLAIRADKETKSGLELKRQTFGAAKISKL